MLGFGAEFNVESRKYSFLKYMIRGLFSVFFSRGQHRKYLRVYYESSFNVDSVFCSMVNDSIGSHPKFLPRALNSEFSTLEAYICFRVGGTSFLMTYLESLLKDDSIYNPENFLRCSRVLLERAQKKYHKQKNRQHPDRTFIYQ
jgi:hypothetical protein